MMSARAFQEPEPIALSPLDRVEYAVVSQALMAAGREMGVKLIRSSYSNIVREAQDASAALFDRDGNVVAPVKMHVVAITMFGKYRVAATINPDKHIQRLKTTVNDPTLGDFNIEHESTNQVTVDGIKWPTNWHSHQGWDDNWQFFRQSTGHNAYGGSFPELF